MLWARLKPGDMFIDEESISGFMVISVTIDTDDILYITFINLWGPPFWRGEEHDANITTIMINRENPFDDGGYTVVQTHGGCTDV